MIALVFAIPGMLMMLSGLLLHAHAAYLPAAALLRLAGQALGLVRARTESLTALCNLRIEMLKAAERGALPPGSSASPARTVPPGPRPGSPGSSARPEGLPVEGQCSQQARASWEGQVDWPARGRAPLPCPAQHCGPVARPIPGAAIARVPERRADWGTLPEGARHSHSGCVGSKYIPERSSRSGCWCSKGIPHHELPGRLEGNPDKPAVLRHASLSRPQWSCALPADPRHGSLSRPQGDRS
jgi:hypothetical protein